MLLKINAIEVKLFMRNLLKIKKGNISIFLLLIFNQFLLNSYAISNKKIYSSDSRTNSTNNIDTNLFADSNNNENQYFFKRIEELEKYFEKIDSSNNIENFKYNPEKISPQNIYLDKSDNDSNKKEVFSDQDNLDKSKVKTKQTPPQNIYLDKSDNDSNKKEAFSDQDNLDKSKVKAKQVSPQNINLDKSKKKLIRRNNAERNLSREKILKKGKLKNKKGINKRTDFKKNNINILPFPSKGEIFTSEFELKARGYVKLKGPKITLNLKSADSIDTLKLIGRLGNYGIVIVEDNNPESKTTFENSKITVDFKNKDISDVFNSILLTSNLQAVLEKNIIFIGKNILNKSIKPKISKTYRLNQVNAASVADYLSTLGAEISKVLLISGSLSGSEVNDSYINKKEFKDEKKNSYGIEGGPLYGLIGTADLRLQTITLIGTKDLIKTAEKYIKSLDVRHRQVALTVKIIDVALTKADLKENIFEFKSGETQVIGDSGISIATGNFSFGEGENANVPNIFKNGLLSGQFFNWLQTKITNESAKVLASPTLILGENPNVQTSGAAGIDDGLKSATIGRPFKNEGFIKVGETVVTGFKQSSEEGRITCTASEGTAGITFGAKIDKIDDNGYVTFALSPAISSITRTVEIAGCGIQNTLSVRKLDTGAIRVKDGETLVLTGVLKDEDNISTSKVPVLGDIPIFGALFRKDTKQKRKSELIILVTPRILEDN